MKRLGITVLMVLRSPAPPSLSRAPVQRVKPEGELRWRPLRDTGARVVRSGRVVGSFLHAVLDPLRHPRRAREADAGI